MEKRNTPRLGLRWGVFCVVCPRMDTNLMLPRISNPRWQSTLRDFSLCSKWHELRFGQHLLLQREIEGRRPLYLVIRSSSSLSVSWPTGGRGDLCTQASNQRGWWGVCCQRCWLLVLILLHHTEKSVSLHYLCPLVLWHIATLASRRSRGTPKNRSIFAGKSKEST